MSKIRCAVIGTSHGMAHVVQVLKHPRLELAAVCNSSSETLNYLRGEPVPEDLIAQIEGDRREAIAEAERGLENLRLCLAAQEALDSGRIVERSEAARCWIDAE